MTQLIPIILFAALAWFWWDATRARETAIAAAAVACRQCKVQLLDETVALRGLRLGRDSRGHWRILRKYIFEFSEDGQRRAQGYAIMVGARLAEMHLELLRDDCSYKVH